MDLSEAVHGLRLRNVPCASDLTRTLTIGVATSPHDASGKPLVLERPVFVIRAEQLGWEVWRHYRAGHLLVASFEQLRDAVEFAVMLVDGAARAELTNERA